MTRALQNPFARFVRELIVEAPALDQAARALAERRLALRERTLREGPVRMYPGDEPIGDAGVIPIGPMSQALPLLRTLEVEAPRVDWTQVNLTALERLRIHADVGPEQLRTIIEWVSAHPKLRAMSGRSRFVAEQGPGPRDRSRVRRVVRNRFALGPALTSFWWNGRGENR